MLRAFLPTPAGKVGIGLALREDAPGQLFAPIRRFFWTPAADVRLD